MDFVLDFAFSEDRDVREKAAESLADMAHREADRDELLMEPRAIDALEHLVKQSDAPTQRLAVKAVASVTLSHAGCRRIRDTRILPAMGGYAQGLDDPVLSSVAITVLCNYVMYGRCSEFLVRCGVVQRLLDILRKTANKPIEAHLTIFRAMLAMTKDPACQASVAQPRVVQDLYRLARVTVELDARLTILELLLNLSEYAPFAPLSAASAAAGTGSASPKLSPRSSATNLLPPSSPGGVSVAAAASAALDPDSILPVPPSSTVASLLRSGDVLVVRQTVLFLHHLFEASEEYRRRFVADKEDCLRPLLLLVSGMNSKNKKGSGVGLAVQDGPTVVQVACSLDLLSEAAGDTHKMITAALSDVLPILLSFLFSDDVVVARESALQLNYLARRTSTRLEMVRRGALDTLIQIAESLHTQMPDILTLRFVMQLFSTLVSDYATVPEVRSAAGSSSNLIGLLWRLAKSPKMESLTLRHVLHCMGSVCFHVPAAKEFLRTIGLRRVLDLQKDMPAEETKEVRRLLAVLGANDHIHPIPKDRGIRILALDGGGTRGLVTIEMLRALERESGQRIIDTFDVICGTSTGSILAFLLVAGFTVEELESLYRNLSDKVFYSVPVISSSMQLFTGYKYKVSTLVDVLQKSLGMDDLLETTLCRPMGTHAPCAFAVATLASQQPAAPYLFRNYNLPPGRPSRYEGTCQMATWQGCRASSAAPTYFEPYVHGDKIFKDGAMVSNNPSAIALHEARQIWPGRPVDCLLSLGTGTFPPRPVTQSGLSELVSLVIQSCCETRKTHEILLDTMPPGTYFRFNPVHEAFALGIDEIRKEILDQMVSNGREFVHSHVEELRVAIKTFSAASARRASDAEPDQVPVQEPELPDPVSVEDACVGTDDDGGPSPERNEAPLKPPARARSSSAPVSAGRPPLAPVAAPIAVATPTPTPPPPPAAEEEPPKQAVLFADMHNYLRALAMQSDEQRIKALRFIDWIRAAAKNPDAYDATDGRFFTESLDVIRTDIGEFKALLSQLQFYPEVKRKGWLRKSFVAVKVPPHYLPATDGDHAMAMQYLSTELGRLMYEIRALALDPVGPVQVGALAGLTPPASPGKGALDRIRSPNRRSSAPAKPTAAIPTLSDSTRSVSERTATGDASTGAATPEEREIGDGNIEVLSVAQDPDPEASVYWSDWTDVLKFTEQVRSQLKDRVQGKVVRKYLEWVRDAFADPFFRAGEKSLVVVKVDALNNDPDLDLQQCLALLAGWGFRPSIGKRRALGRIWVIIRIPDFVKDSPEDLSAFAAVLGDALVG